MEEILELSKIFAKINFLSFIRSIRIKYNNIVFDIL